MMPKPALFTSKSNPPSRSAQVPRASRVAAVGDIAGDDFDLPRQAGGFVHERHQSLLAAAGRDDVGLLADKFQSQRRGRCRWWRR